MEAWVSLFEIFLKSAAPETEASQWLHQAFNASSSTTPTTPSAFLSLLTKSTDAVVMERTSLSTHSSPPRTKRVMFVETLPSAVQARILSFLVCERQRFCARDLSRLARNVLSGDLGSDFWVQRAARNLLDALSESNYEWISCLNLESPEEVVDQEFESVPAWLKEAAGANDVLLPWLPISIDALNSATFLGNDRVSSDFFKQDGEEGGEELNEVVGEIEIERPANVPLELVVRENASSLKARIMNFESSLKTVNLAHEIRQLCLDKGRDSFMVLALVEPWVADDETASVLISHLANGSEEELSWPSQVLCSVILPKLLFLEEPASRVLLEAITEYCKVHQKAAEYALLLPLIFKREGINNPICDVITRIIRECLHPAHVSAFCQKLLSGEKDERRVICLPCHQHLLSNDLVWTESLFNLFQNILNHDVHLTQDCIDHIVHQAQQLSLCFSKSLKFGNFLLCLVTKCSPLLKSHKVSLIEVVENTSTLVTKSILSRLANL